MNKSFENYNLKTHPTEWTQSFGQVENSSRRQAGFTLIELLVVIAIIGILSSVVLVSLQQTRSRGKDASAKISMANILTAAENYYTDNGDYDGVCESSDVIKLREGVAKQVPATGDDYNTTVPCSNIDNAHYTTYVVLNGNSGTFCVDSSGFAGILSDPASLIEGQECVASDLGLGN